MSGLNLLKRKRGRSGQVQTLWTLVVALTFAGVAIAQYVANTRQATSFTTKTVEPPHHFTQDDSRLPASQK